MTKDARLARLHTRWAYKHLVACRAAQAALQGNFPAMEITSAIETAIETLAAKDPNWAAALDLEKDLQD
jgi:hypothetical protein